MQQRGAVPSSERIAFPYAGRSTWKRPIEHDASFVSLRAVARVGLNKLDARADLEVHALKPGHVHMAGLVGQQLRATGSNGSGGFFKQGAGPRAPLDVCSARLACC
jgi:hypothetical protein